jgi:hypothetical protein
VPWLCFYRLLYFLKGERDIVKGVAVTVLFVNGKKLPREQSVRMQTVSFPPCKVGPPTVPKGALAKIRLLQSTVAQLQAALGKAAVAFEKSANLWNWCLGAEPTPVFHASVNTISKRNVLYIYEDELQGGVFQSLCLFACSVLLDCGLRLWCFWGAPSGLTRR